MGDIPTTRSYKYFFRQVLVVSTIYVNTICKGAVVGFPAILLPSLREPTSYIRLTIAQESWIAAIIGFSQVIGNVAMIPIMDIVGRKRSNLISVIPMLAGWVMIFMSQGFATLLIARFLQGLSMGLSGPLAGPVIGEAVEPKLRGPFLVGISLSFTIGVLVTQTVRIFLSWQYTALVFAVMIASCIVLILFSPESPPWLVSKGRVEDCRTVFTWLRGIGTQQVDELEKMIAAQSSMAQRESLSITRLGGVVKYLKESFKKPELYKPLIIMLHLHMLLQSGGINILSSYMLDIINNFAGQFVNAEFWMVVLNVERIVLNVLSISLIGYFKRRTMLFTTGTFVVVIYISKGTCALLDKNDIFHSSWLPITLLCLYIFSLSSGFSSIPFTLGGEIFPLEYRGIGGGFSGLIGSLSFFVAVKAFPLLMESVGLSITYYIYTTVVIYCLLVLWFLLPETKDKTLQEIEDGLKGEIRTEDEKVLEPLNASSEANKNDNHEDA